jgi:KDO2-lipid IV(A) lauroyltransferase
MSRGAPQPHTALLKLLALLPLPLLHGLGYLLGSLFALLPNRHRFISQRNLSLCYPDKGEYERARLLVKSLRETAKTALETPLAWQGSAARLARLIKKVEGEGLLQQGIDASKGVIIASPHLGSWDIVGQYLQSRHPLTCMYKPQPGETMEALMVGGRTHLGMQLAPTDARGVRTLLGALKRGELIGILPDQEPGDGSGLFAPFFGTPALTMTLLPKLAAKSGAAVLVAYAERLSWGRGYIVHLHPCDEAVRDADPAVAAAAMNRAVEQAVRECPTQYQWSYKRFRRRPEGEAKVYAKSH